MATDMVARAKRDELLRLRKTFEDEAAQFHDLSLSILYFTQQPPLSDRQFRSPNHQIMLWQYYGEVSASDHNDAERLIANLKNSDTGRFGLRGSQFSCFALVEGPRVEHFIRMALRAGSLFSEPEALRIGMKAQKDFQSNSPGSKPIFVSNRNLLAVWLNYVLHNLRKTHPRYLPEVKVSLDPFAASLSAIDKLLRPRAAAAKPRTQGGFENNHFRVALSFPGEHRPYVEEVAASLLNQLGEGEVFYDNHYKPQLARPNLDLLLQQIYHRNSDLVVVFLCGEYEQKEWCGLEWRAVRDIIKQRQDDKIMLLRFDRAPISGLFGIDGFIDVSEWSSNETATAIIKRLGSMTRS
jgi:hypothetical protein